MSEIIITDEDLKSLRNKVVIVTGGSSGIGKGAVELLLGLGVHIVNGDVNPGTLEHGNLNFVRTDVTSWSDLIALFRYAQELHGRVDHVFANAGIAGKTNYLELQPDANGDLLEPSSVVYDINLKGCVNTCALGLHYLRKQESGGSIVITASASSYQRFRSVDYTATKHAVLGFMRGLIPHINGTDVRVNAITPSWTLTGLVPEQAFKLAGAVTQTPADVARSVALLMADGSRQGQVVYSQGGKYKEIEESLLLRAPPQICGDAENEDVVMGRFIKSLLDTKNRRTQAEASSQPAERSIDERNSMS